MMKISGYFEALAQTSWVTTNSLISSVREASLPELREWLTPVV